MFKLNPYAKDFTKFHRSVHYLMPDRYVNEFYKRNAPMFSYVNWFIQRGYEVCFPYLVKDLQTQETSWDKDRAAWTIRKIIEWLEPCGSLIDVNFPVKKREGHYEVVRGFRAMHALNLYDTPCLGGMRICSDLSRDHVKAFSILSTFKHACLGIEMSGAHGGLKISGCDYEPDDLRDIVVGYGRELARRGFLGSYIDILEPDLYCGCQEMEWIAKECTNDPGMGGELGIACAVGKPKTVGGLEIYEKFLAHGVIYALKLFMNESEFMSQIGLEGDLSNKKFIIQGLGKAGTEIVKTLTAAGAKCVGIKEHDAFISMEDGIPVDELIAHKDANGSILEFNKFTKPSEKDEIYTEPCDILIFAATHRSLQCYVAENVQAKIVIEAAHAPIVPTAHKVLLAKKCLVLPDLFAGCGATVASYLEYLKNLQRTPNNALVSKVTNLPLTTSQLDALNVENESATKEILENMMKKTYQEILDVVKQFNLGLDIRTAAYINAMKKIFGKIIKDKKY